MRHRLFQTFSLKHLDFILLALVAALNGIGIAAIGSAEHDLQGKQMEGLILGFVVAVFLSALDYHRVIRFSWLYYAAAIFLLALVFTPLGVSDHELDYGNRFRSADGKRL